MFKIDTMKGHERMSTQDLLLAIGEAVKQGETDFEIKASGQHDIGGPLWHPEGKKLHFHVWNAGQRTGSMCLPGTEIVIEESTSADVGWLNAGGIITVKGDAGDTAGHCSSGGKIFIGGRGGTRTGSLMKHDPLYEEPELWILKNVGSFSFEFMGGGKALVNAYFRSAEALGVEVRYESPVDRLEIVNGEFKAAYVKGQRITAKSCVLAAGGFESNREWLREAWGQNERGEWPADNFIIRGTAYNQGVLLKHMLNEHQADGLGDPTQAHMVAIDARAPLYDGGICTRIDCVSLGVVVNREAERFYDEGEDFWPKRYAIWGRLVAQQPGQIAYSIIDSKAIGRFMPPVFPGVKADSLPELAQKLGLDVDTFMRTLNVYNGACKVGKFDHTALDDCHTEGVTPAKTHWARPIDTAPFYGYALRPGVTFTYLGLKVDDTAAVRFNDQPSRNLFVAGEMMAGNVLGKGYTAGVGMSIGTAFGRIAGRNAALAAAGKDAEHGAVKDEV